MKPHVRVPTALLAALFAAPARAGHETWLPHGQLFPALATPTIEADNYVAFVDFHAEAREAITMAMVALGNDFPFYRRDTRRYGSFQIGLFGDFQSQFNLDTSDQALINIDYFVGFPVSWRHDAWSARLRLFHQSSHLGDELLLSGDAPPRQDLSYEAADLALAYDLAPGLRGFAGATYILRKQWDALRDASGMLGLEYVAPDSNWLHGHWLAAASYHWSEAYVHDAQSRFLGGVRWGEAGDGRPTVTIAATAFRGAAPFGQFFGTGASYYGAILYFTTG